MVRDTKESLDQFIKLVKCNFFSSTLSVIKYQDAKRPYVVIVPVMTIMDTLQF